VENQPSPSRSLPVLKGIPLDINSSYLQGSAGGPQAIRSLLNSGMMNWFSEDGIDLEGKFFDSGDLNLSEFNDRASISETERETACCSISSSVEQLLEQGRGLLCLGGDHSISYPIIAAHSHIYPNLSVLHLDAHPDLYDSFDGSRYSHACPFARIMEKGLIKRLVQVGIRAANMHQRQQADRFGVEMIEISNWKPETELKLETPLYLSLDLDVIDPAFAPGVSHHEPGGFSSRQVIELIRNLPVPLVGADLVELNPNNDPSGITAALGAKLVKEIINKMV
jgi:arginase